MEYLNRSLSAKLKAVPLPGSFRKSKDYGDLIEQEEEEEYWVFRSLPERWRMTKKFDTVLYGKKQKVIIDLGLTASYRKEVTNYVIRAEIFDLLWDSNMFSNDIFCRGWFIDVLEVQFQPLWRQEEIVTGALFPPTSNAPAYFGTANQAGITGFISRNPTLAVSMSNTRSQQTSQPMYICKWERGPGGLMSLKWKLNLWCSSSNLEYPKLYELGNAWPGSKVPMLPPDYEKGNFNGLDFKPKVEWVVPTSEVRAGRATWRVTVRAHLSCISSKKGLFSTQRAWDEEEFIKSEEWKFSKKKSGHIDEWQSSSASGCRASLSQCHYHHSCRNPVQ